MGKIIGLNSVMQRDILFKTDDFIFSYRVAGILIKDGKILLQKSLDDDGFAFPGGHVALGELNSKTLIREFKEETNLDIEVGKLLWVGEIFFLWGKMPCHQICLYYEVSIQSNSQIPLKENFFALDDDGNERKDLEFLWISSDEIKNITIYPEKAKDFLRNLDGGVIHFIEKDI